MKKIFTGLLAFVLLLVAAVAAGSYWFGFQSEKIYSTGLQQFANRHKLTIASHDYQRGWLSATSKAVLTDPKTHSTLKINSLLQHGPLPVRSTLDGLRTNPMAVRPVQAIVHSHIQLQIPSTMAKALTANAVTRVSINADADTTFQLEAGTMQSTKGGKLQWTQTSGNVHYRQQLQQINGQFNSPQLIMSSAKQSASLENIDGQFKLNLKDINTPETFRLTAKMFRIKTPGVAETIFKQFFIELPQPTRSGNKTRSLQTGFQSANWHQQTFGLARFSLSSKALEPLWSSTTTPPSLPDLLSSFKTRPPHINARLQMATDHGAVEGSLELQLDPQKLAAVSPLALFAALQADASLTLPRALLETVMVEKLRAEILVLQQQGKISALTPQQQQQILDQALPGRMNALISSKSFVQLADGRFSSHLQIRDTKLLLNDTPLNLFDFLGKFSAGNALHGLP